MKNLTKIVISATLALSFSTAMALDGGALYLNPSKGGCSACHGKDANSPIAPTFPKLAGQNSMYIFNQMKDIQSGSRSNGGSSMMKGVMPMTSDAEKQAIADWISKQ